MLQGWAPGQKRRGDLSTLVQVRWKFGSLCEMKVFNARVSEIKSRIYSLLRFISFRLFTFSRSVYTLRTQSKRVLSDISFNEKFIVRFESKSILQNVRRRTISRLCLIYAINRVRIISPNDVLVIFLEILPSSNEW